ncbi:PKD domain-containing protein [Microbulbifer sp. YPW16]|uniref:PKD domain-containing protein n=1 Tax=Microbulbifer sp. YPW16 TaxID=2904242 RepID=UPI001E565214|nr:hypothetical protein [Microbulbifer sp. YPW16]UHQ53632.1 hypothetical protein LVE68_08890 [Microbulbifer sp. YPW16]
MTCFWPGRMLAAIFLCTTIIVSGCGGGGGGGSTSGTGGTGDSGGVGGSGGSGTGDTTQNQPPIAHAGEDIVANEETTILLSAGQSTDSDGMIDSFQWEQLSGPSIEVESWEGESISFVAPVVEVEAVFEFQVTVNDNEGASAIDQVIVTVVPYAPISQLDIRFPYNGSRFFGSTISVVGSIERARAAVDSVGVRATAGAGEISVEVQENGVFLINDLPLPVNDQSPIIQLDAYQDGVIDKSVQVSIENKPTLVRPLFALDKANTDKIFALDSTSISNDRLFRVDLKSGKFDSLIGTDTRLPGQPWDIVHDVDRNRLLILNVSTHLVDYIDLETYDSGVVSSQAVGSGPIPELIYDIEIDPLGNQVLGIDESQEALYSISLTTGDRKIVSSNDVVGTGIAFSNPSRLTVDTEGRFAYVYSNASLIAVELETGNRSVATSASVGEGPTIADPFSMAFDPVRKAVVYSQPWSDIYRVFVDSGDSEVFSENGQSGVTAGYSVNVLYDSHYDRYLVGDIGGWSEDSDSVFTVDSSTAERSIIIEQTVGSGPGVGEFYDFYLGQANNGYLLDYGSGSLQKVDLSTGVRTEVSGVSRGSGPVLQWPRKMEVNSVAGTAYILQQKDDASGASAQVLRVDLETGDRTSIAADSDGMGPVIMSARGIAFSNKNNQLYFADAEVGAVIALNLSDLSREIVSSAEIGSGEGFINPTGINYDSATDRIFVADAGLGGTDSARVFSIDVASGDRTTIYEPYQGVGPYMNGVADLDLMPDGKSLLIRSDFDQISLLDIETGDRAVVADQSAGEGEFLMNIRSVAISQDGLVAYFTGYNHQALFAVNLKTGDRVMIAR